jgi:chromosomal replication initiation ATPase DnaA
MTAELNPLDDAAMAALLKIMAARIGLVIPDKIATYLLNRIPKDFQTIKKDLALINQESYVQKKKVSIPLVKAILNL